MLGTTPKSACNWTKSGNYEGEIGRCASPTLHAIAILFARNAAERERVTREHQAFALECPPN
jgi:hypothetical protein